MTREELEKMSKDAIINICLKQETEMNTREVIAKYNSDKHQLHEEILNAICLIVKNYKK